MVEYTKMLNVWFHIIPNNEEHNGLCMYIYNSLLKRQSLRKMDKNYAMFITYDYNHETK